MNTLYLIPARAGSKGIPGKNHKLLGGKPLILYSLELARQFAKDEDICISTDDEVIARTVKAEGYELPFVRPASLASDTAGTHEVMMHAIDFYAACGVQYERLVLLQPTSPFRTEKHLQEALAIYTPELDIVVSVKISHASPYLTLMEEDANGWLHNSKPSGFVRRQDAPEVYELNGAIYIINTASLRKSPIAGFTKKKKYVMEDIYSIDIDSPLDWLWAETILEKKLIG